MAIGFTPNDWARLGETYTKWWNHTLERPLIKATAYHYRQYTGTAPRLSRGNCTRLDISPEEFIERESFELERMEYLGDAFPFMNLDSFGPGVLAAYLGANLHSAPETGTVWFDVDKPLPIEDMHFEFDENNPWLCRLKDIYHAGGKKWGGSVVMGMTDLGGVFDVLSSLRGAENLLMDLYDSPDEVKRVAAEIQECWLKCYRCLNDVIMEYSPGYSFWDGLFCTEEAYITQCDFSYMIGPDMFRDFILDGIRGLSDSIPKTIYHLDGKGELPHLPYLLSVDSLDAIQWVAGDGQPVGYYWIDVYRKIRESGKNMQIYGGFNDFRKIMNELGTRGMYMDIYFSPSNRTDLDSFMQEYMSV